MRYISYKVDKEDFIYSYIENNQILKNKIPIRINNKINEDAKFIANKVLIEVEAEKLEIINDSLNIKSNVFFRNINNNIINSETSQILGKMIAKSLKEKETINLSCFVIRHEEKLKKIEYLIEEIDTFLITKNKKGIENNLKLIIDEKENGIVDYLIEEYYLPILKNKTKNLINTKKRA